MSKEKKERNQEILRRKNECGESFRAIGEDLGICQQRTAFIYYREMDRTDGWRKLREMGRL